LFAVGEQRRLRVFDNRVLRRIYGSKMNEVTGEWRKLHNEERKHSPPNITGVIKSRRMRWARQVACKGKMRGTHRILVGKPKGKRPLGRTKRRWEENITSGSGVGAWTGLI